jgi:hypothetical protein
MAGGLRQGPGCAIPLGTAAGPITPRTYGKNGPAVPRNLAWHSRASLHPAAKRYSCLGSRTGLALISPWSSQANRPKQQGRRQGSPLHRGPRNGPSEKRIRRPVPASPGQSRSGLLDAGGSVDPALLGRIANLYSTLHLRGTTTCPPTGARRAASCATDGLAPIRRRTAGQYSNLGTASAQDSTGAVPTPVTASDPDRYFGVRDRIPFVPPTAIGKVQFLASQMLAGRQDAGEREHGWDGQALGLGPAAEAQGGQVEPGRGGGLSRGERWRSRRLPARSTS